MREQNIYDAVDSVLLVVWCMFIIGGCTYLVFWMDASGWWYVLAVFLIGSSRTSYSRELSSKIKDTSETKPE